MSQEFLVEIMEAHSQDRFLVEFDGVAILADYNGSEVLAPGQLVRVVRNPYDAARWVVTGRLPAPAASPWAVRRGLVQ